MWSCSPRLQSPITNFDATLSPTAPSYDSLFYWAFHPLRDDAKQLLPKNYLDTLFDYNSQVDVLNEKQKQLIHLMTKYFILSFLNIFSRLVSPPLIPPLTRTGRTDADALGTDGRDGLTFS